MEAARAMPAPARVDTERSGHGLTLAPPARAVERELDRFELPPPDRVSGATLAALAALAGMAAIALGLWAFVMSVREDGPTQVFRAPISEAAQAISLLSKPTTVRVPLAGAEDRAILAVASNGRGMIVLDGLGLAPVGRTYQAWVVSPRARSAPLPAATFSGVETVVPLTARVEPGSLVGLTLERPGGVSEPTSALELTARRPPSR
jgi:Anti-sigma-K factor rskA